MKEHRGVEESEIGPGNGQLRMSYQPSNHCGQLELNPIGKTLEVSAEYSAHSYPFSTGEGAGIFIYQLLQVIGYS